MMEKKEYVIKEDELTEALRLFRLYEICPSTIDLLESNIRSRPLSGEIHKSRNALLTELIEWLKPQGRPLLKQRVYRKLLSLIEDSDHYF
jgi:hypothetical protein